MLTPVSRPNDARRARRSRTATEVAIPTAPWPLDVPLAWLMAAPTAAVLAVLGVAFLVLGARRRRPFLSREFAA